MVLRNKTCTVQTQPLNPLETHTHKCKMMHTHTDVKGQTHTNTNWQMKRKHMQREKSKEHKFVNVAYILERVCGTGKPESSVISWSNFTRTLLCYTHFRDKIMKNFWNLDVLFLKWYIWSINRNLLAWRYIFTLICLGIHFILHPPRGDGLKRWDLTAVFKKQEVRAAREEEEAS